MSADYPRVSTILRDLGFQGTWGTAYHLARGQALHRAIQLDLHGSLDPDSIHPDIGPAFTAWRRFRQDVTFTVVDSECEVIDPTWRVRGHPDLVADLGARRILIDYKMTDSPDLFAARHQLGAYVHLWNSQHPDQVPVTDAGVLQLSPKGEYRLHGVSRADLLEAIQTFLAAVRVWHATAHRRNAA
jgi:hypothetical protein